MNTSHDVVLLKYSHNFTFTILHYDTWELCLICTCWVLLPVTALL